MPFHRTVTDFLEDPDILDTMREKTATYNQEGKLVVNFDVAGKLAHSLLWCFKSKWFITTKTDRDWEELNAELGYAMKYLQQRGTSSPSQIEFLEAIDETMSRFWKIKSREMTKTFAGKALGNYQNHWSQDLVGRDTMHHTAPFDHHPIVWLALTFHFWDVVKRKINTELSLQWDDGWGYIFAILACSAIYSDSGSKNVKDIIKIVAQKSKDIVWNDEKPKALKSKGVKQANPQKKTLWNQLPWEIIVDLQPRTLKMNQLPTDMRRIVEEGSSEIDSFGRWVDLATLFIEAGSNIDYCRHLYGEDAPVRKAIKSCLNLIPSKTSLSGTEWETHLDHLNRLKELLVQNPPKSTNTAGRSSGTQGTNERRPNAASTAPLKLKQRKPAMPPVKDGNSNEGGHQGQIKHLRSRGSAITQTLGGQPSITSQAQCYACEVFRELAPRFKATTIIEEIDKSWDKPKPTVLADRIEQRIKNEKARDHQAQKFEKKHDVPWNVMASKAPVPKSQDPGTKSIPGAVYITSKQKRSKKRGKGQPQEPRDMQGNILAEGRSLSFTITEGEGLTMAQQNLIRDILGAK